jgi:uncharacterized protein (TIGR02145 family)
LAFYLPAVPYSLTVHYFTIYPFLFISKKITILVNCNHPGKMLRMSFIHILKITTIVICLAGSTTITNSQTYLAEDFSDGQMPPVGWIIDNVATQWSTTASANAGGTAPEARFMWVQQINISRLISPQIDLTGLSTVYFQFQHMYDDYEGDGPAVGVATRSGSGDWNSVWEILPTGNVGPELVELEISNPDVGQPDFHQMTNKLNLSGYLPLSQPYNSPPWNYYGTENVTDIPNSNVIDWVLVELIKNNPYPPPQFNTVARQAAFILHDGSITGLDGNIALEFNLPDTDSFYVFVHHRNHLPVMSVTTLTQTNGAYTFDFTQDSGMAIQGNQSMKQLAPDTWGIISGDGNADGQINNSDKNEIWFAQLNNSGYFSGDYNMDGKVNEIDLAGKWKTNSGKGSWKPDTTAIPFVCGDTLLDVRDGHHYETIQIGDQCWMKENLNYETGTSWCYYNSSSYCDTFGRLYNWTTIMNGAPGSNSVPSGVQGICPEGWHLPGDAEWCILTQTIDSTVDCIATGYNGTDAGDKMKDTILWNEISNGTNESGFSALPGGCMGIYHFDDLYLYSYTWSSTEDYPGYAWIRKLSYGLPSVGRFFFSKARGCSVRCIKD